MSNRFEQRFTVTEDHIKLLEQLNIGWYTGENDAPAVDSKRPFGNSDLEGDIIEITGRLSLEEIDECEGDIPAEHREWAQAIYLEMAWVLEIMTKRARQGIVPGEYRCDRYRRNWTLVDG